jgi:Tfp pilus assembly protein PilZ
MSEIVEYKLDAGPSGLVTPYWVTDGGQFRDPDDHTLIGRIADSPRRQKVPDTVLRLTPAELQLRVAGIHSRYPYSGTGAGATGTELTSAEVAAMVAAWVGA